MNELVEFVKNNNFKYDYSDNKIVIYNSNNSRYIEIILDVCDEYIVSFETQHCHFNDVEDILDYINRIIDDDVLSIEFYINDKRKFGGDISKDFFNKLSIDSLVDYFGFDEDTLSHFDYEVYSWSGVYDVKREPVTNLRGE